MGKEFEQPRDAEVPATPEQVWEAIATGPGIDSWFLGRNEVEAGQGGTIRTDFGGIPDSKVTVWDPPHRLAYGSEVGETGGSSPTSSWWRAATALPPSSDW